MSVPHRSFLFRHRIISMFRDLDVKGIRRLSLVLPSVLLPSPKRVGKHVISTLHGVDLLIDPSIDSGVELSIFQTGTYEKGTIQLLHELLQQGNSFLDIGANIGLMSTIMSAHLGSSGRVYAIEANLKTVEVLRHNLKLNSCENVEVYPIALGEETGIATLYENWNVNRGGASLISQGDKTGIRVPVERLDDLFPTDTPIHVVKIDVEGFEPQVIRGGMQLFSAQTPVFIIEVSSMREHSSGASPEEVMALVASIGNYSFFKQKGTKERLGKLIPILSPKDLPEHDNIVCIPMKRMHLQSDPTI